MHVVFFCMWSKMGWIGPLPGQAVTLWLADLGLGLNPDNFLKWDLTFKYSPSTCGTSAKKSRCGTMHIEKNVSLLIFEMFDD